MAPGARSGMLGMGAGTGTGQHRARRIQPRGLWAWGNDPVVPAPRGRMRRLSKREVGRRAKGEAAHARHAEQLVGSFVNN